MGARGGEASFSEINTLATTLDPPLRKRVELTGSWDNFVRDSLGIYRFRGKSCVVRMQAETAEPGGLMLLRQVELIRANGTLAETSTLSPAESLLELRTESREGMAIVVAAAQQRYAQELQKLERELQAKADAAGLEAVAREKQLLKQSADAPVEATP